MNTKIIYFLLACIVSLVTIGGCRLQRKTQSLDNLPLDNSDIETNTILLFSSSDLADIRNLIQETEFRGMWLNARGDAKKYCNPDSPFYADPAKIDVVPKELGERDTDRLRSSALALQFTQWIKQIGFAYQMTGDDLYGEHGARLLVAVAHKLPVTHPPMSEGWEGVMGNMMRGMAIGYDWIGDAMSDGQKSTFSVAARMYVMWALDKLDNTSNWWVPNHNFMGVVGGAAGCLAITLRDDYPDDAPVWIDKIVNHLQAWFNAGFDEKGAYIEGVNYLTYGIENVVIFADALLRYNGIDLLNHPNIKKIPYFLAMSKLPGESVYDARNDSNYRGIGEPFILKYVSSYRDGLSAWLWEETGTPFLQQSIQPYSIRLPFLEMVWRSDVQPLDPLSAGIPLGEHFEGRGLCIWRTGWDKKDMMFSIEAGPFYPITHNHADEGHFTLYGLGYRWAVDSGYGNTGQPGSPDQSIAHNLVLVNGIGQAPSGAGRGTEGKILKYEDHANYGYALVDATDAYNINSHGVKGAVVEHALRHAIFVRANNSASSYAVIMDDIRKDDYEHDYTWQMLTYENMNIVLDADKPVISAKDGKAKMLIVMHASEPIIYDKDVYKARFYEHPRFRATTRAVNPMFTTVLVPQLISESEPDVVIESTDKGITIRIHWDSHLDTILWKNNNEVLINLDS